MKVLVSTKQSQGMRSNDFSHATEGELVMFGSQCDGERVDGRCGCRRCLVGVDSAKGTTTFVIVERADIDMEKLKQMLRDALKRGGWIKDEESAKSWEAAVVEDAEILARVANAAPVGSIVERRGDVFQTRERAATRPTAGSSPSGGVSKTAKVAKPKGRA